MTKTTAVANGSPKQGRSHLVTSSSASESVADRDRCQDASIPQPASDVQVLSEKKKKKEMQPSPPESGGSSKGKKTVKHDSGGLGRVKDKQTPKVEASERYTPVSIASLIDYRTDRHMRFFWRQKNIPFKDALEVHKDNPSDQAFENLRTSCKKLISTGRSVIKYAAFYREDGSDEWVAVKFVTRRSELLREACKEFRQLSQVRHPHIIAALAMFQKEPGAAYVEVATLLFPLARANLAEHLNYLSKRNNEHVRILSDPNNSSSPRDPFPIEHRAELERLISYMPCLCHAILYLHQQERPIRHRDIKPQNILIDSADGVVLADFDISKEYSTVDEAVTDGATESSKQYAPHHVNRRKERSFEWDINSLGFVFAEILTVIMGESRYRFFHFLEYGYQAEREYVNEDLGVSHARGLSSGRTSQWLDELCKIPQMSPDKMPLPEFAANLPAVVKHIKAMMRAELGQRGVLEDAHSCLKACCQPCVHCETCGLPTNNAVVDDNSLAPPRSPTPGGRAITLPNASSLGDIPEDSPAFNQPSHLLDTRSGDGYTGLDIARESPDDNRPVVSQSSSRVSSGVPGILIRPPTSVIAESSPGPTDMSTARETASQAMPPPDRGDTQLTSGERSTNQATRNLSRVRQDVIDHDIAKDIAVKTGQVNKSLDCDGPVASKIERLRPGYFVSDSRGRLREMTYVEIRKRYGRFVFRYRRSSENEKHSVALRRTRRTPEECGNGVFFPLTNGEVRLPGDIHLNLRHGLRNRVCWRIFGIQAVFYPYNHADKDIRLCRQSRPR